MEWTNEKVLEFIKLYRAENSLWDNSHRGRKNRNALIDAWERIKRRFSLDVTVLDLKRKKESLMSTYRLLKKRNSIRSGAGGDDAHETSWFAYAAMDSFLNYKYEAQSARDSESISNNTERYWQVTENENSQEEMERKTHAYGSEQSQGAGYRHSHTNSGERSSRPPNTSRTPRKRKRLNESRINWAIKHLKAITDENKESENEFDLFCRSLAVQLKNMPVHRALLCQKKLLSVMVKERLSSMGTISTLSSQPNSPSNQSSLSEHSSHSTEQPSTAQQRLM